MIKTKTINNSKAYTIKEFKRFENLDVNMIEIKIKFNNYISSNEKRKSIKKLFDRCPMLEDLGGYDTKINTPLKNKNIYNIKIKTIWNEMARMKPNNKTQNFWYENDTHFKVHIKGNYNYLYIFILYGDANNKEYQKYLIRWRSKYE